MNKHDSDLDKINTILKHVLVQNQHFLPDKMDSPRAHNPATVVLANKKAPSLEGGQSTKFGGM